MHEASLVESLLATVEAQAKVEQFQRVRSLTVTVGVWSGVDPHCLEFAFNELCKGTLLEKAKLIIVPKPLQICCGNCDRMTEFQTESPESVELVCEHCHSKVIKLVGGKEFMLTELEVEET